MNNPRFFVFRKQFNILNYKMKLKQFLKLTMFASIPLFIMGYFLMYFAKINPENIIIECDFNNGFCFYGTNDDYVNPYNTGIYFPIESQELKVVIKNMSWMLNKRQQIYSIENIEAALNNEDKGNTEFIRADLNVLKNVKTPCYFSRYKDTDIFEINTSGHYNSACPGDLYFKPFIGDLEILKRFDRSAIYLYKQLKFEILIKSIFIFLIPFLSYLLIIVCMVLFKRIKSK